MVNLKEKFTKTINFFSVKYKELGLRGQLLIVMLFLTLVTMTSLAYIHQRTEEKIFNLVEDQIDDLTKAIEISVEQITAEGKTDEARLFNYIARLKKKGIKEVSILSNDQEVILSSNPKRVGTKLSVDKNELIIRANIGEENGLPKKIYNVIVPVVVQNTQKGYIHLSMYLDDFERLSREMHYKRLLITILIFGVGIILSIFISYKYTQPISFLINSAKDIALGKSLQIKRDFHGELGELVNSFNEMLRHLEAKKELERQMNRLEQQAMLGQLASGIAHEIRNPMNLINLTLDHIDSINRQKNSGDEIGLHIQRIKEEVRRINHLISNFLDLGRELKLQKIDIRADILIDDVINTLAPKLREKKIVIEKNYSMPVPIINVDIDKMKSCLSNIIINSIDAIKEEGKITIAVNGDETTTLLSFSDTGEGIASENIDKIFTPFFTTKKTGIGLGLAITKRIIEAHGGSISAESRIGGGTTIVIKLLRKI
jgi:signal transduction histidine kinase